MVTYSINSEKVILGVGIIQTLTGYNTIVMMRPTAYMAVKTL